MAWWVKRFKAITPTNPKLLPGKADFWRNISTATFLGLFCGTVGKIALWQRIGREPLGNPFNALVSLKKEQGKPRNPFTNIGAIAIAIADRLSSHGNEAGTLLELLSNLCFNSVHLDPEVAQSGADAGFRSHAVANFMKGFGKLDNPVAAGEFAHRIGLPCKRGVGGGIVAVVPDQSTLRA